MKKKILLVRPSNRHKNYQELADNYAAIEPPLWMAVRAREVLEAGFTPVVVDEEVGDRCSFSKRSIAWAEIFPLGNHPSSFVIQGDLAKTRELDLLHCGIESIIHNSLPKSKKLYDPLWDLFDLDKYRAHNWHCWGGYERSPCGVVSSSVGCPFNCKFCCINNFYGGYSEYDIDSVFEHIEVLVKRGVTNIKFIDEIFFLKPERVEGLCRRIIDAGFKLNAWVYARIDTVDFSLLPLLKQAGFNWICLGIESGNFEIRRSVTKGNFTNGQIEKIVSVLKSEGISVLGNFMVGFPDEDQKTVMDTYKLAKKLQCEYANFYCVVPYPGSEVRSIAQERGWEVPQKAIEYSQLAYEFKPLQTKHLSSRNVLSYRDWMFENYYTDPSYLNMIRDKFGKSAVADIEGMTKIKIKRKLLGQ